MSAKSEIYINSVGTNKAVKRRIWKKMLPYWLLSLPAMVYLFLFHYLPMFGVVIAFKDYKVSKGIMESNWVGIRNFKYFFKSIDAGRILRNTVGYNLLFLFLIGIVCATIVALMLYEIRSKLAIKVYQTSMLIPFYMSYVVIASIALIFLNPSTGLINTLLTNLGLDKISWYSEPKYWPYILTFVELWREIGMASLYFYAALLSIDTSLFEAASLDGASRLKQIINISLPELVPMLCIIIISRLGSIMGGAFGLFYVIPMDSAALYPTTDVLSTYIYRGLATSNYSYTAAVGLLQSVVGLILVLLSNFLIRKINPKNSMF